MEPLMCHPESNNVNLLPGVQHVHSLPGPQESLNPYLSARSSLAELTRVSYCWGGYHCSFVVYVLAAADADLHPLVRRLLGTGHRKSD